MSRSYAVNDTLAAGAAGATDGDDDVGDGSVGRGVDTSWLASFLKICTLSMSVDSGK